jgi:hypothetical protein
MEKQEKKREKKNVIGNWNYKTTMVQFKKALLKNLKKKGINNEVGSCLFVINKNSDTARFGDPPICVRVSRTIEMTSLPREGRHPLTHIANANR